MCHCELRLFHLLAPPAVTSPKMCSFKKARPESITAAVNPGWPQPPFSKNDLLFKQPLFRLGENECDTIKHRFWVGRHFKPQILLLAPNHAQRSHKLHLQLIWHGIIRCYQKQELSASLWAQIAFTNWTDSSRRPSHRRYSCQKMTYIIYIFMGGGGY